MMDYVMVFLFSVGGCLVADFLWNIFKHLDKPNRRIKIKRYMVESDITYKLEFGQGLYAGLRLYKFYHDEKELFTLRTRPYDGKFAVVINEDISKVDFDLTKELRNNPELLRDVVMEDENIKEV